MIQGEGKEVVDDRWEAEGMGGEGCGFGGDRIRR